jgi:hypothetical protein
MRARLGVLALLLLAACSRIDEPGPFPVVGKFDDYNEVLSGDFRIGPPLAYITARAMNAGFFCEGVGRYTYRNVFSRDCSGWSGLAVLDCNNGRRLIGDWRARTCTSGEGTGTDDTGARFSFAWACPGPKRNNIWPRQQWRWPENQPIGASPPQPLVGAAERGS